jgi:hypothetical protein
MSQFLTLALVSLTALVSSVLADDTEKVRQDSMSAMSDPSFVLGIGSTGIGLGNTRRLNGIRLNLRDRWVEEVNGINLTMWKAKRNPHLTVNGLALGLVGPEASRIRGIGIGPIVSTNGFSGVGIGLFALASDHGDVSGIGLAGLAVASDHGNVTGINIAGLAVASDHGNVTGINAGGLAVATDHGNLTGINAAGLAIASDHGDVRGINVAGLVVATDHGAISGLNASGLVIATDHGDIFGINATGLVLATDGGRIRGINVSGGIIAADDGRISGLAVAGGGILTEQGSINGIAIGGAILPFAVTGKWMGNGWRQNLNRAIVGAGLISLGGSVYSPEVTGVSVGIINGLRMKNFDTFRVNKRLTGVSIGLLNLTHHLRGLQIGLLNYAGNNPVPFRLLPLLNLNLGHA